MGLQRVSPTFPQISLLLRRQLTLISTRHRRQHHRQRRQQRHHRQHHPSDSAALIISFLWPMFLASRMQTAFCDFVTVIGHINLCSRTALEQLLPPTAKNRAATVAASAASCPMSDTRCPMSSVHCPLCSVHCVSCRGAFRMPRLPIFYRPVRCENRKSYAKKTPKRLQHARIFCKCLWPKRRRLVGDLYAIGRFAW